MQLIKHIYKFTKDIILIFFKHLQVAVQFIKHGVIGTNAKTHNQLEGRIIALAHGVEKGLSYKNIRPFFGVNNIRQLLDLLKVYRDKNYSLEAFAYQMGYSAIYNYKKFHKTNFYSLGSLANEINHFLTADVYKIMPKRSVQQLHREEVISKNSYFFSDFIKSRHSVRYFADQDVDTNLIIKAIEIARNSPSACNRQSCKVYAVKNRKFLSQIAKLNRGGSGFANQAKFLLIITTDLGYYLPKIEQNFPVIDGTILAINLLYSLHSIGLATCFIGWIGNSNQTKQLYNLLQIPQSEKLIITIAVGHYASEFKVPQSSKRPVNEIVSLFE